MSAADESSGLSGFRADYQRVFVDAWSPYLGAVLLVLIIFALMVDGLFWGVFGGLKLWGTSNNPAIRLKQAMTKTA